MPVLFLETKEPLARQVAAFLLADINTLPIDLADTQVWVPTSGAGRRIREALATLAAERGTGVLSPAFLQPMQALLPENRPIATRSEREAAWLAVLRDSAPEDYDQLLPDPAVLTSATGGLGVAGMFCDLGDLLAEGGLDPAHSLLTKICDSDAARWEQLAALHAAYLRTLAADQLHDPNALRLDSVAHPRPAPGIRHVVVACIPDLAQAAAKYLDGLARNATVTILIWKPAPVSSGWDAWGRPLPDEWATCPIAVESSQIAVSRQADEEAASALDFLAAADTPGDFALALADETLGAQLAGEITRRSGVPFQPEGRVLATEEAAKIALEWEKWRTGHDLRVLRNLLQFPHFHRWLGGRVELHPTQLLSACDHLIAEPLAETLEQAQDFIAAFHELTDRKNPATDWARSLLGALDNSRDVSFPEILTSAWERSPDGTEAARRVLEIWEELSHSPLYLRWPEGRLPSLSRALRAERVFTAAPEGSIELSGWLETPWLEAERIAVCGCVEGRLPTSVGEHPFLPDSKRAALGLQDNARRLARDAYLLTCLLARHRTENLRLSFSRFDAEGSPALPSRLLLRTSAEALPARIQMVFAATPNIRRQPSRENGWLWSLPENQRRLTHEKISPTQCRDYLACPLRFYWKNVLRLDTYDADPREMDARRFGILLHRAVEEFGRKAPDESKRELIEKLVLEEFATEARRMFGPSPTAAIRVQLESGQVRLRAFAREQAKQFAAGWRILEVEKKFTDLTLGPLKLSAQVDRIEQHPEHGWRVMDYKTFSNPDLPEKKHFGPPQPDHFLPQSQVVFAGKAKSWIDLQLPLYRHIAALTYESSSIQACYFLLPADPSETQVMPLELDAATHESALTCAEEIATRISRGIFWPPQSPTASWGDALGGLFLNGAVEKCFDANTIEFLKGRP
ncbi:MAG: PD-(D/E)XK nuclease family protein [Chthoniobacterales bacterium]